MDETQTNARLGPGQTGRVEAVCSFGALPDPGGASGVAVPFPPFRLRYPTLGEPVAWPYR